jgi:hypothetical protein
MPGLIGIQANCATFGYTSRETATLLQVKLQAYRVALKAIEKMEGDIGN